MEENLTPILSEKKVVPSKTPPQRAKRAKKTQLKTHGNRN